MKQLIVLLLLSLGACAHVPFGDKVNASLSEVRVTQFGPLEQTYAMRIRLQNPTAKQLELKGMSFEVELNGRRFARGVSPRTFTLAPYSETVVDVNAVSDTPSLLTQILRVKASKLFRYRLTGSLHTEQLARQYLPFDQSGEIDFSSLVEGVEGLNQPEER